jgi:PAS domain S-box-containing protein
VWVHDTSTPIPRSDDDGARYFQGFLVDISARKEAQAARAEAEHRYRTMVEALPAVTYIDEPIEGDDLNATMPFVSPQVEQILGYPPERFMQDNRFWFSLMHPEDYSRMRDAGALSVSNLDEVTQEYRMRHADGRWVWVQDTSKPVYDDDGRMVFFQGFLMDVTARHEAVEALREAERRFRVLVEQMPAAIYRETVRQGGGASVTEYMSPQIERLIGYAPSDIVGRTEPWAALIHPDDRERVAEAVDASDASGEPFSLDYRVRWTELLAGVPDGHHRADRRDRTDPGRGGAISADRRTDPGDHLSGVAERERVRRVDRVVLRQSPDRTDPRLPRRPMARAGILGQPDGSRGPRSRARDPSG